MMTLKQYFENTNGTGVLATADASGRVNAAIFGRPHFMEEETIAFIMPDRLTHENLKTNGSAVYLFRESGGGYAGKRLYLTRTGESEDAALIEKIRSRPRHGDHPGESRKKSYLVYFAVDRVLPLIGDGIG